MKEINDSASLKFASKTAQTGIGSSARREHQEGPRPIRPLGGTGVSTGGVYHDNMSQAD